MTPEFLMFLASKMHKKIEKSHKNTVPSKRGMSMIKMEISWSISGKHPKMLIF